MKSYAIFDDSLNKKNPIGYLFYYEKAKEFIIELSRDLNEWEAPLLLQFFVKNKIFTISKDISYLWIKERIIPSNRQNIGSILKANKLKEYDEMTFLKLSKGKCAQDECYIEEINLNDIPKEITNRKKRNIEDCFFVDESNIICLFKDNTVRKINLDKLKNSHEDIRHIIKNKVLRDSMEIDVGGYGICFNKSITINVNVLRKEGELLNIKASDFISFLMTNVIDTTKACEILKCSRQNIAYFIKKKELTPIIKGKKENMYLKSDILRLAQSC